MRVLLISPTFEPRTGGLETYLGHLALELARLGHEVAVLTSRDSPAQPPMQERAGLQILRAGSLLEGHGHDNYVPWERSYFALLNDVSGFGVATAGFDVVHCHTQVALLLAHLSGLNERYPIVASFHETDPHRDKLGEERTRFVLRSCPASRYAVGSEAFAAQARSFGIDNGLIRVVRMGIAGRAHMPRGKAREALHAGYGVPTDGCLITLLGRFTRRKEHRRALTAYARMRLRRTVRLLFVGSDNSTQPTYVREVRELVSQAGGRVHLLENLPDRDRDLVVDASDLGVQPSSKEGLGLAPIEFMMAGVPVIVSNIDGLRETVGKFTSCLVDTGDIAAFSLRLDQLVASVADRDALGRRLKGWAAREFSIGTAVSRTLNVYAEVV